MTETDMGQAEQASLNDIDTDYEVTAVSTDAAGDQKEYTWQNEEWSQQLGYYKKIPELQAAIDAKANWTMGAGFEADNVTELHLLTITGNGKDSFNTILSNMIRTYTISGDSYCEIIRDRNEILINLKPLDPATMVIVANRKGKIIRYEQTSKTSKAVTKYKPEQILHFSRKRIADEIHGISIITAVEWIILARNEAMSDWRKVLHRNVNPMIIFHLDTDDPTKIASIKAKQDKARSEGENLYVPKGGVVPEVVSIATNATMNPLTWINQLNDYFFQVVNVPQIIVGNAKEFTDASGKIVYLSYEQSVKGEQLYVEEQILNQLNIEIALTFPASLQNELLSDVQDTEDKKPAMTAAQPADTTATMEGKQ